MNANAPHHLYEWAPVPETRDERQRREQQERQNRQAAFYDTEKGFEMLSKAMCSYIRYDRTLEFMKYRRQNELEHKVVPPKNVIIKIFPETFIDFLTNKDKPSVDQVFHVVNTAKDSQGKPRFSWEWTSIQGQWKFYINDHVYNRNVYERHMERMWHLAINEIRQELAHEAQMPIPPNIRPPRNATPPPAAAAPRTIIVEDVEEIERQEDQERAARAGSSNKITSTTVADMD